MPELPEVEGFRRRLAPLIVGRRIARFDVLDPKLWRPDEGLDAEMLTGRTVVELERRAKLMLFHLDEGLALILHLKIAGQLVYVSADAQRIVGGHPYPLPDAHLPDASTRFVLSFAGKAGSPIDQTAGQTAGQETPSADPGETLYVNDQRRFAWLRLLPESALPIYLAEQRYGPDPLDPGFTPAVLAARLEARRRRPVKAALLDQTCIAGLGNIYADESLHSARLHPMLLAGDLTLADVARLHGAIKRVLEIAVPVGGALVKVGRAIDDRNTGRDFLRAHGRAGEVCPDCAEAGRLTPDGQEPRIVRAFLAGRGTYFCPVCQSAPPGFVLPDG